MRPTAYRGLLLTPDLDASSLAERLGAAFPLLAEGERRIQRRYFDTFDWRLWTGDVVLFEKRTGRDRVLMLQDRVAGHTLTSVRAERTPAWPGDIPAGELRDRVAGLVDMRALLPVVTTDSKARVLRILNEDEKTVVRLRMEEITCNDGGSPQEPRKLPSRVRLVPVRGYAAEAGDVAAYLHEDLKLAEAPHGLLDEALAAVGKEAGDYSSKLDISLAPDMRADAAARRIFLHLLDTLERNVAGTKADLDSEFLHDLRVATRRTRAALTQIKGVLPAEVQADFRQRFGWLGKVTGPTRDLDVFLLELPRYQAGLPPDLREDISPLRDYLAAHQRREQKALRRKLGSAYFRKLLEEWRAYLESELPSTPSAPNALRRVKDVADQRIWRMYRLVLKEGRAIDAASPPEELHELRKSCKKLRYLLEFFQSVYDAEGLKPLIKHLKVLLDNLGAFQDLHVQAEELMGFAAGMQAEGQVPLRTLLAMGALVGDLLRHQQAAREQFQACFAQFDTKENRTAYRAAFKPATSGVSR